MRSHMHVARIPSSGGEHLYYLRDFIEENGGARIPYMYAYGHDPPSFYEPEFHNGKCEDILMALPDGCIDLIIDDPPYGKTEAQWDIEPDWDELTALYNRVLDDQGLLVIFGRQPSLIPVYNAFTNDGFEFRFEIIWRKQNNPWVSNYQPIPIHENIFIFKKKGVKVSDTTFNIEEVMRDAKYMCRQCEKEVQRGSYSVNRTNGGKAGTQNDTWDDEYQSEAGSERYPISVLEYKSIHSQHEEYMGYAGQKPTDLLRWLIIAMSDRGDTILDPHAGSASTLAASLPLCRPSIGIEVDSERYADGQKRIDEKVDEVSGLKHAEVIPTYPRNPV